MLFIVPIHSGMHCTHMDIDVVVQTMCPRSAKGDQALYPCRISMHAYRGNRGSACCGVGGCIDVSTRGCEHYRRMLGEVMKDVNLSNRSSIVTSMNLCS